MLRHCILTIWQSLFSGVNLFRDKTSNLGNQTLKVTTFPHIPGTAAANSNLPSSKASILSRNEEEKYFHGTEIEVSMLFIDCELCFSRI